MNTAYCNRHGQSGHTPLTAMSASRQMTRKGLRGIYLLVTAVICCTWSCDKAGTDGTDRLIPIRFDVEDIAAPDRTRGMDVVDINSLLDYGFGISASYSERDVEFPFAGDAVNYFLKTRVDKVGESWVTVPISYWPIGGKLSFFAYAPYNVNSINEQAEIPSDDYVSGPLTVDYTPAENVSFQSDFCVAKPVYNQTYTGQSVVFNFRHTLCRVFFSFSYKHDGAAPGETGIPAGTSLAIDQIDIEGVTGSRRLTYIDEEPFYVWGEEKGTANYTLKRKGDDQIANVAIPRTVSGDAKEADISKSNGRLYLLPQTVNADADGDATITISASLVQNIGTSSEASVAEFIVTKEIPETVWPAGGGVRYHITLDLTYLTKMNMTFEQVDTYNDWITPYQSANSGTSDFHID